MDLKWCSNYASTQLWRVHHSVARPFLCRCRRQACRWLDFNRLGPPQQWHHQYIPKDRWRSKYWPVVVDKTQTHKRISDIIAGITRSRLSRMYSLMQWIDWCKVVFKPITTKPETSLRLEPNPESSVKIMAIEHKSLHLWECRMWSTAATVLPKMSWSAALLAVE